MRITCYIVQMSVRCSFFLAIALMSCQSKDEKDPAAGNYLYDLNFLRKHDPTTIELSDKAGQSRVLLSSRYQGRVMTSTSAGESGNSYGWINYDLIASHQVKPQFNPVGGEERFWLGPEGGQYSLYFAPGDSFDIGSWQVPPIIDTISYNVVEKTDTTAVFEATANITNYSGTVFDLRIGRRIELADRHTIESVLDVLIHEDVRCVGYQTFSSITNTGSEAWKKETGLISIWLLGMFTPSPSTTVIIPFLSGSQSSITTDYFGDIPADRLEIREDVLLFKCDGKYRSKIGLSPLISNPIAGSYDAEKKILTIISFKVDGFGDYVNSKWEIQDEPYRGDVLNSYNDGPLEDGSQLGPFYELESSSSVKELAPGEGMMYSQLTCHLEGDEEALRYIAMTLLRVDINKLTSRQ